MFRSEIRITWNCWGTVPVAVCTVRLLSCESSLGSTCTHLEGPVHRPKPTRAFKTWPAFSSSGLVCPRRSPVLWAPVWPAGCIYLRFQCRDPAEHIPVFSASCWWWWCCLKLKDARAMFRGTGDILEQYSWKIHTSYLTYSCSAFK